MDPDNRSLDLGSSLLDASVADGLPVEAKVRARKAKHGEREQHSQLEPAGPGLWRDEHHALADARWTKAAWTFLAGLNPAAGERRCVGRKNPDQLTAASA